MFRLRLGKKDKKMKTNLLILSLFVFSGCAKVTYEPAPIDYIYVTDIPHNVCAQKKIINKEKMEFEQVKDLPLVVGGPCDGGVVIAKENFLPFKHWLIDLISSLQKCIANGCALSETGELVVKPKGEICK